MAEANKANLMMESSIINQTLIMLRKNQGANWVGIKLIGSESVCNRLISDPEREDNYEKLEYNYYPTPESIFLFEHELKK